jgi:hypothetical protein
VIALDLSKPKHIGNIRTFSSNVCIRFPVGIGEEGSMLAGK